jgi:hypothetical protein
MVITMNLRFIFALEIKKLQTIKTSFMRHFENISQEELQTLENAVSQIALLIAISDGNINHEETEWATKLVHIRTYSSSATLRHFYEEVEANFNIKLADLMKSTPKDTEPYKTVLFDKIAEVNSILAKLDPYTAFDLYRSYLTLAKSVAKSSGGILGFWSISKEEQKLIDLPMITPIAKPDDFEEEEEEEA